MNGLIKNVQDKII